MEFKIVLAGTAQQVEGTENFTKEEALSWLEENQIHYKEDDVNKPESGDLTKYVILT